MSYEDMEHCAIGAMEAVGATHFEMQAVQDNVLAYLREEHKISFGSIPDWNDANGRTAEEVRDTLLMVAKRLRNNED